MSPTTTTHEILQDDNYFLWEFNARMTLAKKELLEHIAVKPEGVMAPVSVEWKVADMKALALIAKMLSPTYQSMIRDAGSAAEAWFILREFFVKRSLHNRIQLRKQLHEFQLTPGDNIMDHLLRFDDLCMKLAAVGDDIKGEERLVILLGSLSSEYDAMVKIIEARGNVDLYEAKEMLRREYDTIQKRKVEESAFQAMVAASRGGRYRHGRRRNQGRGPRQGNGRSGRQGQHGQGQFNGRCFECNQIGHKRGECPQLKAQSKGDQYVLSVSNALADTPLWLLDSGASSHMTYRREDFEVFRPFGVGGDVLVANGHRLEVRGTGSVRVALDGGRSALITDVLYIPGLDRKLLSVSALTAKGAKVKFEDDHCVISYRGTEVVRCSRMGKLYALPGAPREAAMASSAMVDDVTLWHARLGHAGQERLATIDKVAAGVPRLAGADASGAPCEGCVCGKMTVAQNAHTSNSVVKADALLALVHSDVIGLMETQSKGGARYVLEFVDDWLRYVQVYMIKLKSEVLTKFKEYKAFMEAATGARLRCIRTDNGGGYTGKKFNQFCSTNGILHQTSAPYSPAQNGLTERMNRSLTEMARAMLYYQHLPKMWWAEAIATAAYTLNRLPNTARRETTPFELLWNVKPSLSHMREFGSRGFVYVDALKRTKWDAKAHRCIFLGYSETSKAYRVWDTEDERLVVSRTIALDERPPSDFVHGVLSEMPTQLRWSTFDDDDDLRPESRRSSVRDAAQPQDDAMEVDSPPHTDGSMEDSASNGMSAAPAASGTNSDSPVLQPGLVSGRHAVGELGQGGVTRNMQLERAEQSAIVPLSHDVMGPMSIT